MTILPVTPARLRPFRVLSGVLSVAFVLAIVEVLAHGLSYESNLKISQLALATFANAAVIGSAGVALILLAWALGFVISVPARTHRQLVLSCLLTGLPGLAAGYLAYSTRVFGLADKLPAQWAQWAVIGAIGAMAAFGLWRLGISLKPSMMNLTRSGVIIAWLACVAATAVSLQRTREYVRDWTTPSDAALNAPTKPGSATPNMILVILDTLRADKVGAYGSSTLTPNLDKLAESSIVYNRAISTAPWTLPSHASFLTGLYPEAHGVSWGHYALRADLPVLPALLAQSGYQTFAISNNKLLNEDNGFARGFDKFLETTNDVCLSKWKLALRCGALQPLASALGLSRDAGFDQGSAWTNWLINKRLANQPIQKAPFFAMINYFEPHDPYVPPERYLKRFLTPEEQAKAARLRHGEDLLAQHACGANHVFSPEDIGLLEKLYDADVAYQDERIGELVHMLRSRGLLDNTWLVVTSDHGELFGEWEMVYHTASAHYKLLHLPLIVRPPGGRPQMVRIDAPVQPVDVFTTFLAQAGIALPEQVTRAYPLPLTPDEPTKRDVCVAQTHGASIAGLSITQRHNLQADVSHWLQWVNSIYEDGHLLEIESSGRRRLFNVDEDPLMQHDLAEARGEVLEQLAERFQSWSALAAGHPKKGEPHDAQTHDTDHGDGGSHSVARAGD